MNMYVRDGTDTCMNYSLNSSTEMALCTLKVAGGLHVSLAKKGVNLELLKMSDMASTMSLEKLQMPSPSHLKGIL
jgi:hypothetical protein